MAKIGRESHFRPTTVPAPTATCRRQVWGCLSGKWALTRFTRQLPNELKSRVSARDAHCPDAHSPEAQSPDVYDSMPRGYRYSGSACISEICISCYPLKFSASFPSLLLQVNHQKNMKGLPRARPFFGVNLRWLVSELH